MNSGLRASRTASAARRSASTSRPGTAGSAAATAMAANKNLAASPSRPGTATQRSKKTFLQDNEAADALLPQPLPPGIPYVASFTTYDDLIDRRILAQPEKQQVRLTTDDVRLLYDAKCADQNLKPSWNREMRFLELISTSCRGQHFVLRENALGARTAEAVARVLATNETFTVLDLSGNRIKDEGARAVAGLLNSNDMLVHLGLKSNDIGPDGIVHLCDALHGNCSLTSLDLGGIRGINRNHVGGRGAEALGNLLATNAVLHTLDVSSNGLGLEGCGLVAAGLAQNHALRRLYLSSNNVGPDGCRLLASVLQDCRLELLDLRRNAIGDAGAAHIAAAFKAGTDGGEHILTLMLEHNEIREAGARALAPMVRTNQSLKHLYLSQNNLGPGLCAIFEALRDNRKMKSLHVVQSGIQENEAKALAKSLEGGSGLEHLDISRNRMPDSAGVAIFRALTHNGKLQHLNLGGCSLANETAAALAAMMRYNKDLTHINLRQNLLAGPVGDVILEELKAHHHVRTLDLAYNDIPYLAQTGIQAALAKNLEIWKAGEGSRWSKKVDDLAFAKKELFQVDEDIVSERRACAEKQDDLGRRRETARGQAEMNRRVLRELEEKLAGVKAVFNGRQETYRRHEEEVMASRQKMEGKATQLNRRIDAERERAERLVKDTERLRKQLKQAEEQQAVALRPVLKDYEAADAERESFLADALWQAEITEEFEQRLLVLERALHVAPDRRAKAAAAGADHSAKATPRRPGSAKRQ
jgi:Ran GTPase-activating protein (RanGAP) involved in mRNA processing and transport